MKNILSFVFTFIVLTSWAASSQSVDINVEKQEIKIGSLVISAKTTIQDVIKVLGEPERIEKIAGTDRIYAYDKSGIVFDTGYNPEKLIEGITITYTFDGDKKVAKEKFSSTLTVDGLSVTNKTTAQELQDKTKIGELKCFGPMCASDPKKGNGLGVMLSVTEGGEIGQIAFAFKR